MAAWEWNAAWAACGVATEPGWWEIVPWSWSTTENEVGVVCWAVIDGFSGLVTDEASLDGGAGGEYQVVITDSDDARFDLGDLNAGCVFHSEELEFDRELILRPFPATAKAADLGSNNIVVSHGGETRSPEPMLSHRGCDQDVGKSDEAGIWHLSSQQVGFTHGPSEQNCGLATQPDWLRESGNFDFGS